MSSPRSLKEAVDYLPGVDTLATLAGRRGVSFGTAIGDSADSDASYLSLALANSNAVNSITGFYPWNLQPSQGVFDFTTADGIIAKAGTRPVLGWAFYPKASGGPAWMVSAATDLANTQALIDAHFAGIASRLSTREAIIVTNERINSTTGAYRSDWVSTPFSGGGNDVVYMFQKARTYFPNSKLFICEANLEFDNATAGRATMLALIDTLLASNLIDGICLQGHMNPGVAFGGKGFSDFLDALNQRGLEVRISEFDARNSTFTDLGLFDKAAADQIELLFNICLSKGVRYFTGWGFRDDYSWLIAAQPDKTQRATPWDSNGRPKQIERAIRKALS